MGNDEFAIGRHRKPAPRVGPTSRQLVATLLCAALLMVPETGSADGEPSLEQVDAMRVVVEEQGLAAFVQRTTAAGIKCPSIPSAWHVRHLATPEQRAAAQAARELGSTLLSATDAMVESMRVEQGAGLLTKARALIDLAYWVGATEGYGNLVLAGRARDVALTGLARLVVDLGYPLAETATLIAKTQAPFDAPAVRARVLNGEVGAALFPSHDGLTAQRLAEVWGNREIKQILRAADALVTSGGGRISDDAAAILEQQRSMLAARGVDPSHADPTDLFFDDESCPRPATTRNCWNVKQHERLVIGFAPDLNGLNALVTFRQTIGSFPQTPSNRRSHLLSEVEEAFSEGWRPHVGAAHSDLGLVAASAYERIQQGGFVDRDTALVGVGPTRTPSPGEQ